MKSNGILFLVLVVTACETIYEAEEKYLPEDNLDAGLVLASRYVSHDQNEVVMEADIVLLDHYSWGDDLPFFFEDEFSVEGDGGTCDIISFMDDQVFTRSGSTTGVLLIDQSGDYGAADPYNYRARGVNKFLQESSTYGEYRLGGFSEGGLLNAEPVEYYSIFSGGGFEDQLRFLFYLAKRTGGSSNLYDAIEDGIDRMISLPGTNKDVVVLLHSGDEASTATRETVIQRAAQNDIRVHLITVGTAIDAAEVGLVSSATGGLLAHCPDYRSMVTVIGGLEHALNGSPEGYTLRIRFVKSGGPIIPGETVHAFVTVKDSYSGFEFNPLVVVVRVPE